MELTMTRTDPRLTESNGGQQPPDRRMNPFTASDRQRTREIISDRLSVRRRSAAKRRLGVTELFKWYRLGWLADDPAMNEVLLEAAQNLLQEQHGAALDKQAFAAGYAWKAVYALVFENKLSLDIGQPYSRDPRAAKAVARHMVRAGLENVAKGYGLLPLKI
jgi:hypothetical protein